MEKKRCCFIGHSNCDVKIKNKIRETAEYLIRNKGVTLFEVGNYGNFDRYSAGVINELKRNYPCIELELIIPYVTQQMNKNKELFYKEYDSILIAEIPLNTPYKFHIIKANEYMVEKSQFMICYIEHLWGGAAKTYEYAKKRNLEIINIAEKKD